MCYKIQICFWIENLLQGVVLFVFIVNQLKNIALTLV
jgi:hypothetical protein